MIIHEINQSCNSYFYSGDITSKKDFLLIDDLKRITTNGKEIKPKIDLEHPIIRSISKDYFIIVDGEPNDRSENAWIIDFEGKIKKSFFLGNATDFALTRSKIIVSYSKCELDTSRIFRYDSSSLENQGNLPISSEGLAVFDFDGNCLFKYMSDARKEDFIEFQEVYSFFVDEKNRVYLLSYLFDGGFSILEFELDNYSMKRLIDLNGILDEKYLPKAMTKKNEDWYILVNNYEDILNANFKSQIMKYHNKSVEKIGECCFSVKMKGNKDGTFSVPISQKNNFENSCFIEL